MNRSLRLLLISAPLVLLLLGVPAGVALARRAPLQLPPPVVQPVPRATAAVNGTPRPAGPAGPVLGPPIPIQRAQNGASGTVTRVGANMIVVYTKAKKLAIVRVDPKATIRMNGKNIKLSAVERGDRVTVLGSRDATGRFIAEAIRVVRPDPPVPSNGAPR
jgi:hypothetical protein